METLFSIDSDPNDKPSIMARTIIADYNRAFMIRFYTARLERATTNEDKQHYSERLKSWQTTHPKKTN